MTQQIGQLTSTELDKTIVAAEWLVGIAGDGLLDKFTWAVRLSREMAKAAARENGQEQCPA